MASISHTAVAMRDLAGVVPPPPGVAPSFDNPESAGRPVIVSSLVCLFFATSALCMRLYTRIMLKGKFEPTDYAFVSSWVFSCALSIISVVACFAGGLGNHIWDLSVDEFQTFLKLKICTSFFYCIGIMAVKLSLLLFYLQISLEDRFRRAVYALIAVVTGYSLASALVVIFSCYPVAKSWDITITDGYCVNLPVFYIANLCLNSVTDIAVLILPIPMLWNVQMPMRQKIAISGIFMTGSGVCVVSILRIRSLVILLDKDDVTWELVEGYVWSAVELNTAIVCAALPFSKPLLRRIFPRLLGSGGVPARDSHSRRNVPRSSFRPGAREFELARRRGTDEPLSEGGKNSSALISESQEAIV